jgi:hypothetical protein
MSTHIIDRIEAVKFSKEYTGHYEDLFIVVELGGDNNLRRSSDNKRARDWSASCIGPAWSVIGQCCREIASYCEGGMTKLKGRQTKPESLIRAYRKALDNAANGLEEMAARGIHLTGRVRWSETDKKEYAYGWEKAIKAGKTVKQETRWSETVDVMMFDLTDHADLMLWFDCEHGNGWNNCETHGPGSV